MQYTYRYDVHSAKISTTKGTWTRLPKKLASDAEIQTQSSLNGRLERSLGHLNLKNKESEGTSELKEGDIVLKD